MSCLVGGLFTLLALLMIASIIPWNLVVVLFAGYLAFSIIQALLTKRQARREHDGW